MAIPAAHALAQLLDCESAAAAEPGMVRATCIHVVEFGYMVGLVEGFADSCGAEEKAIFTDCAERHLDAMSAPGAATPATAQMIRQRYAQAGQDIPDELICEVVPLVVTDTDIGRLCTMEAPGE